MTRSMDHLLARKPQVSSSSFTSTPAASSSSSSSSSLASTASSSGSPCYLFESHPEDPTPVDDDMDSCKFELKLGSEMHIPVTKTAADVRASPMGGNDYVYDKQTTSSMASNSRLPTTGAIEAKIKTLASYLKSVSAGIRRRSMAFDRARLTQAYYRRSVPTPAAMRTKLNVIVSRHSSGEHQTTLSWDDIDEEECLSFGDLNEMMTATPPSRKRGHPSEIFCDSEIRQICTRCEVPDQFIDQVVHIIKSSFGTPELDVIALEEFMPGNVVVFVGTLIFESIDCGEEYVDLSVLPSFLRHIQERYDGNMPFHNATHAADVMHTLFMMLWNTSLGEKISQHNQIGALLAAVMHDVEHVGLTNDFLIKTSHPIAQKYPTKVPMESKHMDLALRAVVDPKYDVLTKMSPAHKEQILEVVRETISATALIYQPELLAEINGTTPEEWKMLEEEGTVLPQSLQVRALRIAMHVSDISQTMKPFANHQKWVFRLNDEHYKQGELDAREHRGVSPSFCFRDQWTFEGFLYSQVCFLRKMALPAVVTLNNIPWLDVNELVNGIEKNIAEWEQQVASH
ncbi:3'5'-cyclic nucleotide phosphodiesterase [Phytophthora infestans]|uniref:Phosphodiesterase n=1 Tax=Phytophthora infestans TaxID=4787 RepID=A0A833SVT9_PHYIN|nr:3'5'-cyclic nucleotide phosphodiesterase [Phytophthora infestans]KAF4142907.1 3'5'-cyclic nucleotide phosphodiesterase [Phytophthora infestans]